MQRFVNVLKVARTAEAAAVTVSAAVLELTVFEDFVTFTDEFRSQLMVFMHLCTMGTIEHLHHVSHVEM